MIGLCICLGLCLAACSTTENNEPEFVLTYAEN